MSSPHAHRMSSVGRSYAVSSCSSLRDGAGTSGSGESEVEEDRTPVQDHGSLRAAASAEEAGVFLSACAGAADQDHHTHLRTLEEDAGQTGTGDGGGAVASQNQGPGFSPACALARGYWLIRDKIR